MAGAKTCFVIGPIGDPGSDTRKRSDQLLRHIIAPAARECGYEEPVRSDHIEQPGTITHQVVEHIMEAGMVVADLSDHKANVFYELAIRHMLRRPVVQVIQDNDTLPFDVSTSRTVKFDLSNPDSVLAAREALIKQMEAASKDASLVDNPISSAIELSGLMQSGKTTEVLLGQILAEVRDLKPRLETLERGVIQGIATTWLAATSPVGQVESRDFADSLAAFRKIQEFRKRLSGKGQGTGSPEGPTPSQVIIPPPEKT